MVPEVTLEQILPLEWSWCIEMVHFVQAGIRCRLVSITLHDSRVCSPGDPGVRPLLPDSLALPRSHSWYNEMVLFHLGVHGEFKAWVVTPLQIHMLFLGTVSWIVKLFPGMEPDQPQKPMRILWMVRGLQNILPVQGDNAGPSQDPPMIPGDRGALGGGSGFFQTKELTQLISAVIAGVAPIPRASF